MATFIVKTMDDRNLFIKADHFLLDANSHVYDFYNDPEKSVIVASVPVNSVFAVLDEDVFEGEFYDHHHLDDPYPEPTIEEDEP